MHSFAVGLLLVAFIVVSYGAPGFVRVPRPQFVLQEYRAEKRAIGVDIYACLAAHNEHRREHDAPPLTWDSNLAKDAQKWADHLAYDLGRMQHAVGTGEGENLFWAMGSKVATCEEATEAWFSEEKDYPFSHPPHTFKDFNVKKAFGHFTQLVWKHSKKLGVGIATKQNGDMIETFIVARYSPPGNMLGTFEGNVQ